jgi:hypothetical protein
VVADGVADGAEPTERREARLTGARDASAIAADAAAAAACTAPVDDDDDAEEEEKLLILR